MTELLDGMLLYHVSYTVIRNIELSKCKNGLDFGQGFYLTSSYQQAVNYIQLSVKKSSRLNIIDANYNPDEGILSVYRFHSDPNLLHHYFQTADAEWLHFVAANRETSLFPKLLAKYSTADVISGKIADDQTAKTLMQYIGKFYGTPGSPEADRVAINQLIPDRLQDQFCFKTQDAINCLEFVRSERYGDISGELSDKERETCAVLNMRDAVAKISHQQNIPYEEALLLFTGSPVYDALFDFGTGIWRESPEYLLALWNEVQSRN